MLNIEAKHNCQFVDIRSGNDDELGQIVRRSLIGLWGHLPVNWNVGYIMTHVMHLESLHDGRCGKNGLKTTLF